MIDRAVQLRARRTRPWRKRVESVREFKQVREISSINRASRCFGGEELAVASASRQSTSSSRPPDTTDTMCRLCVFVDDLDRCMPDVALDLLEAIKIILENPVRLSARGR